MSDLKYQIFIAYSAADRAAASRLYRALSSECSVYMDDESLRLGDQWDDQLPKAQRESLITVVLISPQTKFAHYQKDEIAAAIELSRHPDSNHRVVPVYLNCSDTTGDIPYGLRRTQGIKVDDEGAIEDVVPKIVQELQKLLTAEGQTKKNEKELDVELPEKAERAGRSITGMWRSIRRVIRSSLSLKSTNKGRRLVLPTLLLLALAVLAAYVILSRRTPPSVHTIKIGFGNRNTTGAEKEKIERHYTEKVIEPANAKIAGDPALRNYRFELVVVDGNYSDLINRLNRGDIDLAFVGSYLYLHSLSLDEIKVDSTITGARIIGRSKLYYHAGFLVPKEFGVDSLEGLIGKINSTPNLTVTAFLSDEEASSSGYIVPQNVLLEKDLKNIVYKRYPNVKELIEELSSKQPENHLTIGAISDDSWETLKGSDTELAFVHINIKNLPIPVDPVLISNAKRGRFTAADFEKVMAALEDSVERMGENDWLDTYAAYEDYAFSGIATPAEGNRYEVKWLQAQLDRMRQKFVQPGGNPRPACLATFGLDTNRKYPLWKDVKGYGNLRYDPGTAKFVFSLSPKTRKPAEAETLRVLLGCSGSESRGGPQTSVPRMEIKER